MYKVVWKGSYNKVCFCCLDSADLQALFESGSSVMKIEVVQENGQIYQHQIQLTQLHTG